MRTVIICGGRISDYAYIKSQIRENDIIICADSGYDHAVEMGIKADLVVGDFDSITQTPSDSETARYPAKKNLTDTEIALEHARSMGFRDFLIVAGIGTRMDHTLTNIFILKDCLEKGEHAELIDEHNRIMITKTGMSLTGEKGSLVSLVPLSDCRGVTTENLEYPLNNDMLRIGEGRGVSNIMIGETAAVSVKWGILLVIQARD